jgi:hypothetical protein
LTSASVPESSGSKATCLGVALIENLEARHSDRFFVVTLDAVDPGVGRAGSAPLNKLVDLRWITFSDYLDRSISQVANRT